MAQRKDSDDGFMSWVRDIGGCLGLGVFIFVLYLVFDTENAIRWLGGIVRLLKTEFGM